MISLCIISIIISIIIILIILIIWKISVTYNTYIYSPAIHQELLTIKPTLNILSYNIRGLPYLIKTDYIDSFCKLFEQYDIILVQESFQNIFGFRSKLKDYFKNKYWIAESGITNLLNLYLMENGLMIISKYPIIKSKFTPWIIDTLPDSLAQKGILNAQIQINDNLILSIYTLHMQASFTIYNENSNIRDIQLKQLLSILQNDTNKLKIVGGDFNYDFTDEFNAVPHYKVAKGKVPTSCFNTDQKGKEIYSYPYSLLSVRNESCLLLDYFVVPKRLKYSINTIMGYNIESDHNPVELKIKI